MKKSFVLFLDSLSVLDDLTDEQAGKLFKAMKSYHTDEHFELDQLLRVAFIPFKNQFDRDNEKYASICERNRINGLKGGRPNNPDGLEINQNNPDGFLNNPEEPKEPTLIKNTKKDTDNNKDTVIKNKNLFDNFRRLYPGTKRGLDLEFENFSKKNKTINEIIPLLIPALEKEITHKNLLKKNNMFCPEWKNLQTWINQKCWEQELSVIPNDGKPKHELQR